MKRTVFPTLMCLGILAVAADACAVTNLTVVRRADKTLWTQRCEGVGPAACDAWTKINGLLGSQPILTWDASIGKYLMIGIGTNNATAWKATFNADGSFNNDWREVKGASSTSSAASSGSIAAGGSYGVAWKGAWDALASYTVNDVVSDGGSSYISLIAGNLGNPTSDSACWGVVAEMGAPGAAGPAGPQGQQGEPGNLALAGKKCPPHFMMTGFDGFGNLACQLANYNPYIDLQGADMRDQDLVAYNLSYANLSSADFANANLSTANLVGANFTSGNLSNSIFTGADLSYAKLTGANLSGANLTGAKIYFTNLTGVTGLTVDQFRSASNPTGCNLSGLDLSGFNLSGLSIGHVKFIGTNLAGANLTGSEIYFSNFTGANLAGANLTGVAIPASTVWSNTTCPDGTNSGTNGTSPESCVGHVTIP